MTTVNNNYAMLQQLGLASSSGSAGSTTNNATTSGSGNALDSSAFMQLMITQMKNQDPTNPMDNSQFMSELAQISQTTGIQQLQTSFSTLASSLQSYQALQASGLVGRTVLAPSSSAYLSAGGSVNGQITLSSSTSQLAVGIYDQSGQLVRNINLGTQSSGQIPFSWDGTDNNGAALPAGTYQIKAEALENGAPTAVASNIYSTVSSVNLSSSSNGIELNLYGLGTVPLSQVLQVG